ncbi:MAG: SprT-like domain-containing protein [Rhodospirillales bacterium]|nr:SprT-like domain-containing protein [Rhodospirillales bacterium]
MRRSGRHLGAVADVAAEWGVAERLYRAESLGAAYHECLASMVEADARAAVQAGKAWPHEQRMVLHRELLKPGREEDRNATFLHECAHILADRHYGKPCKHGPLWRATMVMLGELPVTHHEIPYLSRRAHASCIWTCMNCGEEYPFVRKPRRRIENCYCRHCGPEKGMLVRTVPGNVLG